MGFYNLEKVNEDLILEINLNHLEIGLQNYKLCVDDYENLEALVCIVIGSIINMLEVVINETEKELLLLMY